MVVRPSKCTLVIMDDSDDYYGESDEDMGGDENPGSENEDDDYPMQSDSDVDFDDVPVAPQVQGSGFHTTVSLYMTGTSLAARRSCCALRGVAWPPSTCGPLCGEHICAYVQ